MRLLDLLVSNESTFSIDAIIFDLAIKSAVILVLASTIATFLHRASAAVRHVVYALAIVGLCAVPLQSVIVPACRLPILALSFGLPRSPSSIQNSASRDPFVVEAKAEHILGARGKFLGTPSANSSSAAHHESTVAGRWRAWIVMCWLGGTSIVLAHLVVGVVAVWQTHRRAAPVIDGVWTVMAGSLAQKYGIRRRVLLRMTENGTMPFTWGIYRPTVLLPIESRDWPIPRIRAVLAHEFAHIARNDFLVLTLARLTCALYWFNPQVWQAVRRLRLESEHASDDMVIQTGMVPSTYARQLVEVLKATQQLQTAPGFALAMARPSELERRVRAILDQQRSRSRTSLHGLAVATLIASCFIVSLGFVRLEAFAHDVPKLKRLPEGMKIELIGISGHPSGAATWWGPVGRPLTKAPCDPPSKTVIADGKDVREIVARITGLPKGASVDWSTTQSRSGMIATPRLNGEPVPELYAVVAEFPPGQTNCDVHFDLSLGDWITEQVFDGRQGNGIQKNDREFFLGKAREIRQGGTAIAIAHNITDRLVRVVAIDGDGKPRQPKASSNGGSGHLRGHDLEFDVPLDRIKEFQLQTRAVGRFEIKNIAIQPLKRGE